MKSIAIFLIFILSCSIAQAHGHENEESPYLKKIYDHIIDLPHHAGHFVSDYVVGPIVMGLCTRAGFNLFSNIAKFATYSGSHHGHSHGGHGHSGLSADDIQKIAAAVAELIKKEN